MLHMIVPLDFFHWAAPFAPYDLNDMMLNCVDFIEGFLSFSRISHLLCATVNLAT